MKPARAVRLARVKFVALPLPAAAVAAPAERPTGFAALWRSVFRVIGCLEAARP